MLFLIILYIKHKRVVVRKTRENSSVAPRENKKLFQRAKPTNLKNATHQLHPGGSNRLFTLTHLCNELQNSNSSPTIRHFLQKLRSPCTHTDPFNIQWSHSLQADFIITAADESNCFSKALKSKTTLREDLKRGRACQTRTGLNGFGLLNLYTLFQYNQHILFPRM